MYPKPMLKPKRSESGRDGSTNSSGIFTDTYNYSVDVDTIVKARLKGYKFNKAASTITSAGLSIPFTMSRDPAVNLP